MTTVKRKQGKPDTEDPNKGVSLLTIELPMTRNSIERSVPAAVAGGDGCNSMGETCAGQGGCHTLAIAVRFVHVNAATTDPPSLSTTTSCSSHLVQTTAAVPLAQWGGAIAL